MRLLWRLERRGSRCLREGEDVADCAVDMAGVFCSWILEGLDGNIEDRSTRQRLIWLLSVFRHKDFGTMCTIRYRYPIIQYAEGGLGIWQNFTR
jgi:hypothetical protein